MQSQNALRSLIEQRLSTEQRLIAPGPDLRDSRGRGSHQPALVLPLVYPSPYFVGMSSLGYQVVYRLLNQLDPDEYGVTIRAERAFCPEDVAAWQRARLPLVTYESLRPVGQQPAILFSVAYELELTGLFSCLELAGVPVLREERGPRHPLVICGGPLTFSNPLPLAPFALSMVWHPRFDGDATHAWLREQLVAVTQRLDGLAHKGARRRLDRTDPTTGRAAPRKRR